MSAERRTYYDHEPCYRAIASRDGRGWDDLRPGPDPGSYVAVDEFLASRFAPAAGAAAIDLGCGGGQVAIRLARRGYAVAGVDFSETAIALAERNAREAGVEARFAVGDCLTLERFADGAMDLAIDNHLLHCLVGARDRGACLGAAFRVLRPGGIFFSESMSSEGDFDPARVDADPATRVARNGTRFWARGDEIDAELALAGFRVLYRALGPSEPPGTGALIVTYAERPRS